MSRLREGTKETREKTRSKKRKRKRERKRPHHRPSIPSTSTARTSPYRCFEGEASGEDWPPGAAAEAVEAGAALPLAAAASAAVDVVAPSALRRPSWAAGSIFWGNSKRGCTQENVGRRSMLRVLPLQRATVSAGRGAGGIEKMLRRASEKFEKSEFSPPRTSVFQRGAKNRSCLFSFLSQSLARLVPARVSPLSALVLKAMSLCLCVWERIRERKRCYLTVEVAREEESREKGVLFLTSSFSSFLLSPFFVHLSPLGLAF